jgi:hypothetical protein
MIIECTTVAHNGNTQFIFNIQFMLLILRSELFSGRIRSFPTENFFRLFFCEIFSSCNFLLLFIVVFSTGIYFQQIYFQQIYFQPEFIFSRNLFSAEIYFQPKFIFNRNLFSTEICFSRNLFSTESCFQLKFIFSRNLFSTEIL